MHDYLAHKTMPAGDGTERVFDASTGRVMYRMRRGTTTVGGSFELIELTHPMLRINTAKKLRAMRSALKA